MPRKLRAGLSKPGQCRALCLGVIRRPRRARDFVNKDEAARRSRR